MMKKNFLLSLLTLFAFIASAQSEKISFGMQGLYPEGVAFDTESNSFFVGSVTTGQIGRVSRDGKYSVFYSDTSLKSTYGMKVNKIKKQLWVCVSDANYSKLSTYGTKKKLAKIIFLDIATGKKSGEADLASLYPGDHFANDIAIDNAGNGYVTDSFSPAIYRVDKNGKAAVFVKNEKFGSVNVGLNGIVFHPGGYLLVAHNTDGVIYKISKGNTPVITKVEIKEFFPGADGLLLTSGNTLLLVQNKGVNKVFAITSKDDWKTAAVNAATSASARFQNPTTMAFVGNETWVLNAKLNELSDSTLGTSKEFSLQLAELK